MVNNYLARGVVATATLAPLSAAGIYGMTRALDEPSNRSSFAQRHPWPTAAAGAATSVVTGAALASGGLTLAMAAPGSRLAASVGFKMTMLGVVGGLTGVLLSMVSPAAADGQSR